MQNYMFRHIAGHYVVTAFLHILSHAFTAHPVIRRRVVRH
jgi:hypothetical protein